MQLAEVQRLCGPSRAGCPAPHWRHRHLHRHVRAATARATRTGCSAWTFPGRHAVIRMVPDAPVATYAPAKSPPSPRSSRYRDAIDGQPKAQCGHYRHGKKGATSAQASRNSQGALCASKESNRQPHTQSLAGGCAASAALFAAAASSERGMRWARWGWLQAEFTVTTNMALYPCMQPPQAPAHSQGA